MKGKKNLWLVCALMAAIAAALLLSGGESTGATQEERRIAQVLGAISGAGRVEVAVFYAQQDASAFGASAASVPTGAVVVAQGAEDMAVRLQLIRAVRTLLGLPESAVDVFDMEEGR